VGPGRFAVVRRDPAAASFPPASALLSSALLFALEHASAVLPLGLLGSAPFAVALVLYLRECYEVLLLPGASVAALRPLAFGLAGLYLLRFPFRLALAAFMAGERRAAPAGALRSLALGLIEAPAALYYGCLSTLGWLAGAVVLLPFAACVRASLAFQLFAAAPLSAREAYREAARAPVVPLGFRLAALLSVAFLGLALVIWTAPASALGLGEWLLKLDVTALREVLGLGSATWLLVSLAVAWMGAELLWAVAFGLLAQEWERVAQGADIAAELQALESRIEVFA
jgi:hypothetical protein